jgi:hypothetical protein
VWTPARLREAFASLGDEKTAARLSQILTWATTSGSFMEGRTKNPIFGVRSHQGLRIFTFLHDGTIYWCMNDRLYAGGTAERDALAERLRALRLVDETVNPADVVNGRNLRRRLGELTGDEFEDFCQSLRIPSGAAETRPALA